MPRPHWTTFTPVLAAALLAATWGRHPGAAVLTLVAIVLIVLLFMTVVVGILTVVPGRAKPLQGGVHLVLLASFIFLTIAPQHRDREIPR